MRLMLASLISSHKNGKQMRIIMCNFDRVRTILQSKGYNKIPPEIANKQELNCAHSNMKHTQIRRLMQYTSTPYNIHVYIIAQLFTRKRSSYYPWNYYSTSTFTQNAHFYLRKCPFCPLHPILTHPHFPTYPTFSHYTHQILTTTIFSLARPPPPQFMSLSIPPLRELQPPAPSPPISSSS